MTTTRLRALFAAQGIALGVLMPFLVPVLADRGLGPAEIGLALGASGLASLLAYPMWGAIADGGLGRRRTIGLTSLTAALGGLLLLTAGSDPLVITLALSVTLLGALPWGPLIDALSLQELAEPSVGYGRVRAWASFGWAASAILAGVTWLLFGPEPVFLAFSVSALFVGSLVVRPAAGGRQAARGGGEVAVARTTLSAQHEAARPTHAVGGRAAAATRARRTLGAWLPVLASPVLLTFLLGLFVTSVGEHGSFRFVSLRILEQGGGILLVGVAAALPAIVEIPVFGASRQLISRLGLRMLYVWGAYIAAGLMLLVALASEAWLVTALRTLEGTAYALRYVAMVIVVGALLPRYLHAVGQSLAWLVYAGIAPIVADAVGGLVYELYGAQALFVAAAMVMLAGGTIVWLALRSPRFGRGASGAELAVAVEIPTPPPAEFSERR